MAPAQGGDRGRLVGGGPGPPRPRSRRGRAAVAAFLRDHGRYLEAVAAGTVFPGAGTYLGNGPNLLVRAVAEQAGVAMPGFIGYIVRYAAVFLLPTLVVVSAVFFRG